jgi:plastocyanin
MKSIASCCLLFVLALVLLGSQAAPASTEQATASAASTVSIKNFKYHPGTTRIAKGSRVVFSNAAGIAHTATDPGAFDTGHIKPGHSISVRFTRRGTFSYHCTIHPFMHGKIVVR